MITQCPKTGRTCEVTGCTGCWKAEQEPVKRFTSDDVKVAFENGYAAAMSVASVAKEAEQEPVALDEIRRIVAEYIEPNSQVDSGNLFWALCGALQYIDVNLKFSALPAPVRTKDLTDDEILKAFYSKNTGLINGIRAVIAADREKNK